MGTKEKQLLVSVRYISLIVILQLVGQYRLVCEGVRSFQKHAVPTYGGNPPVKTIKNSNGDVVDCVDFYDQPAFEHPLLKNQRIKGKLGLGRENPALPAGRVVDHDHVRPNTETICPEGTVPILRRASERSSNASRGGILKHVFSSLDSTIMPTQDDSGVNHLHAIFWGEDEHVNRISATINLWNPLVGDRDFSAMYITAGSPNNGGGVGVGWAVSQPLFGDKKTRLFVSWSADQGQRGCDNLQCPGFVQTSAMSYLGMELQPVSIYSGQNTDDSYSLYQRNGDANWWVTFRGVELGYFPASLIPALTGRFGTTRAVFGGSVAADATFPHIIQMGSGHFPVEGLSKVCYMKDLKVYGTVFRGETTTPEIKPLVTNSRCYDVRDLGKWDFGHGQTSAFTVGGPGCM